MIGRFSNLGEYRELLPGRDLALCLGGGVLALASYLLAERSTEAAWAASALALVSFAVNGLPVIREAISGLMERRINVDELVSLAFIACLARGEFLTAAGVAFIMKLGSLAEGMVSDSARRSIRDLVAVAPDEAVILRGEERSTVPVAQVRPGDVVLVGQGERVPVDGVIIDGLSALDESSITGESLPVDKRAGDQVFAGTLSHTGVLRIEASRVGEDTVLGRVVRLVEESESHKPQVVRYIDRWASWFTPLVLSVAASAWALSGDVDRAVAVLIAGCPCALIMAAPTATVAAVGRLSRAGILVKGGRHLEAAATVDTVLFDKTGTLTMGQPRVEEVAALSQGAEREILSCAACVEDGCSHPLALAVLRAAREAGITWTRADDVTHEIGAGVRGTVGGSLIEVGGAAYARGETALPPPLRQCAKDIRERGATPLVVYRDRAPLGVIGISDTPRPTARAAVAALRRAGIDRVAVLSGDHERAARTIATAVGIDEVHADLKPESKLSVLSAMRSEGRRVLFVGDGVNDAPALAHADVGVAMGGAGTDVALRSADVVLARDDIAALPFLLRLSRRMLGVVKINAFLGVFLNAAAMLGSGLGLLTPLGAAVAHNAGSVLVVLCAASLAFARDADGASAAPIASGAPVASDSGLG